MGHMSCGVRYIPRFRLSSQTKFFVSHQNSRASDHHDDAKAEQGATQNQHATSAASLRSFQTAMIFECARLIPRLHIPKFEASVPTAGEQLDRPNDDGASPTSEPPTMVVHDVLLDVVGARGLARHYFFDARPHIVDPYCVIRVSGQIVHRTKPIQRDYDPIWTVSTDSLCILSLHDHDTLEVEVKNGATCLGRVELSWDEIALQIGERVEYALQQPPESEGRGSTLTGTALLALKVRRATIEDHEFFNGRRRATKRQDECDSALDVNFHQVRGNPMIQKSWKVDWKDKEKVYRVKPGPDPRRVLATEWLNRDEIEVEAMKPSTHWVSAGVGSFGVINLEILSCDNLPNLDLQNKTDAFVGVVFEDNFLRTCVVWDCVAPRWMPWTSRAYSFRVRHPSSLLMLGVFDYDRTPLGQLNPHDPIGRIVIHPDRFGSDTTYVLTYRLSHDPRREDDDCRGTITIRMRIHWNDEPVALQAPPSFVIHVDNDRSYQVLKYITRGLVDMEQSSLTSVKLYGKELVSYWGNLCYFWDVAFETWLWRGRIQVCGFSVWFPIHSLVLFVSCVLCLEYPHKIVAIALYGLAWILLTVQYHASRHPNPWRRVTALDQRIVGLVTGQSAAPTRIHPGDGGSEERRLEQLDALKASRMSQLIYSLMKFGLTVYRTYSRQSEGALALTTEQRDWSLLADHLYYLHLFLKYLCTYVRLYRNLINWRGSATQRLTLYSVVLATMWVLMPVDMVAWWMLRVWVWLWLGPWMRLVDVLWVRHWYRTKEQLLAAIDRGETASSSASSPSRDLPDLDAWLRSEAFLRMGHRGRVVAEEARKRRAMRDMLLGRYSERVPVVDSSRYPSVPLSSQSRAQPEPVEAAHEEWHRVPGQELTGSMIMSLHTINVSN